TDLILTESTPKEKSGQLFCDKEKFDVQQPINRFTSNVRDILLKSKSYNTGLSASSYELAYKTSASALIFKGAFQRTRISQSAVNPKVPTLVVTQIAELVTYDHHPQTRRPRLDKASPKEFHPAGCKPPRPAPSPVDNIVQPNLVHECNVNIPGTP
ncbi:unnamed protein product, partial [Trichogramma brassicae]